MKPGSPEYFEYTKTMLTASDFAAACGLNPYCSRQQLWDRKVLGKRKAISEVQRDRMQWGVDHEKDAIEAYKKLTRTPTVKPGAFYEHSNYPGLGCTPDGFVGHSVLIEAKCPSSVYDDIPIYYIPQMLGQLAITGRLRCDFVVWTQQHTKIWGVSDNFVSWYWMLPHLNQMVEYIQNNERPPRWKKKPNGRELLDLVYIELTHEDIMNESDDNVGNQLLREEIDSRHVSDQMEQERDRVRMTSEIESILRKCENGMCSKDDIFELRELLRFFNVDC